jgi:hypothetical protein
VYRIIIILASKRKKRKGEYGAARGKVIYFFGGAGVTAYRYAVKRGFLRQPVTKKDKKSNILIEF